MALTTQAALNLSPNVGFFADIISDVVALHDCANREKAYGVTEALSLGASEVLEMEAGDLQVLVVAKPRVNTVDVTRHDPMPDGPGLLDQMIERWVDG